MTTPQRMDDPALLGAMLSVFAVTPSSIEHNAIAVAGFAWLFGTGSEAILALSCG